MAVTEQLANEIFAIEIWHILSLVVSIAVNFYIFLHARKTPLLSAYLLAQLMLILWIAAKILKTVSYTVELRWFFVVVQYFGVSFLGPCLLLFAFYYVKKRMPKPHTLILLFLPGLYSFAVVVTNPLHYQFYQVFTFYKDRFGQLFYINMGLTYGYLAISMMMLGRGFIKMFGNERKRAYLFSAAILIPFLVNILYVFKLFKNIFGHTPLFDYTPIATNVSLIIFALAVMKYRFLDLLPIAKRQIFDGISDAVFIYGRNKELLDCNSRAELLRQNAEYIKSTESFEGIVRLDHKIYRRCVSRTKSLLIDRLTDITHINDMLDEIQEKNEELRNTRARLEHLLENKRKLIAVKASNYILQELHDVLGHATVLSISACEIEIVRGVKHYKETLAAVEKLLLESRGEMRRTCQTGEDGNRRTSLVIAIEAMIQNMEAGRMKAELTVMGSPYELSSKVSQTFYRVCQEAVTNALKHSGATEIHFILRYTQSAFELIIMDNGEGCAEIRPGKGLSGMRDRMGEAGGSIQFSSDIECGFRIDAQIGRG